MNEQEEPQKSREEKAREVLLKVARWELGSYPECIDRALSQLNELYKIPAFEIIKSIISDCICKTVVFLNAKITDSLLNFLANEYADKIHDLIGGKK